MSRNLWQSTFRIFFLPQSMKKECEKSQKLEHGIPYSFEPRDQGVSLCAELQPGGALPAGRVWRQGSSISSPPLLGLGKLLLDGTRLHEESIGLAKRLTMTEARLSSSKGRISSERLIPCRSTEETLINWLNGPSIHLPKHDASSGKCRLTRVPFNADMILT